MLFLANHGFGFDILEVGEKKLNITRTLYSIYVANVSKSETAKFYYAEKLDYLVFFYGDWRSRKFLPRWQFLKSSNFEPCLKLDDVTIESIIQWNGTGTSQELVLKISWKFHAGPEKSPRSPNQTFFTTFKIKRLTKFWKFSP